MQRTGRDQARGWRWQGLLLVLPVVVLALLGALFIRQDRNYALQEARERCQELADDLARQCLAALLPPAERLRSPDDTASMPVPDAHLCVAFHDPRGKLVFPPPYAAAPSPVALDVEILSEAQRPLWQDIQQAGGNSAASGSSLEAWEQFLASAPPAPFAAIA